MVSSGINMLSNTRYGHIAPAGKMNTHGKVTRGNGRIRICLKKQRQDSFSLTTDRNQSNMNHKRCRKGLKGNPVKVGSGPAAVIGDEICKISHCPVNGREGADVRMIQESEDLP